MYSACKTTISSSNTSQETATSLMCFHDDLTTTRNSWQLTCHCPPATAICTNYHPILLILMSNHPVLHWWMSLSSSTTTVRTTLQVGNHISPKTTRGSLLVWRQISCHGRLLLKEGGNFTISWLTNSRTHGNLQHYVGNNTWLLVCNGHYNCTPNLGSWWCGKSLGLSSWAAILDVMVLDW